MEYPLISVIVPIYKVEEFINRCIDSIINQTYHNLEIILVDDGSPDKCGEICDEYAQKDFRIKVIHQKNGGLSAARNSGIDVCRGEYIGFVDSDDFIHQEMYERLYNDIVKYNVKLSFCHPNMCFGNVPLVTLSDNTICKTGDEVLGQCLTEVIWFSAWTKLYHRSLFSNIRYPVGLTHEDYPVTIRVYDRCERIAVNYNKMYNYCIRPNSIVTSKLNISKFDQIYTSENVLFYIKEHHQELIPQAESILIMAYLKLLTDISNEKTHSFDDKKQEILKGIRNIYFTALKNKFISSKQKILLTAALMGNIPFTALNAIRNEFS